MCTYSHTGAEASYLACAVCHAPKHGSEELKKSESNRKQGATPPRCEGACTTTHSRGMSREGVEPPSSPFAPQARPQ